MRHPGSKRSRYRTLEFIAICGLMILVSITSVAPANADVKLNVFTTPDTGVAGVNNVNLTGSGFPSETINPQNVSISFATSCRGPAVATITATSVKIITGTSQRVNFALSNSLKPPGIYFANISDSADSIPFTSSNCSEINVTPTSPILAACVPSSSLGVLAPVTGPAAVTAYVPNGCWSCGSTGIQVVPLEPVLSAPTAIATAGVVNSCAANPATSETVCVANDTSVYTIQGTAVTKTLTSGSTGTTGFSGGSCQNCGVAIDALNNKAVIAMSLNSTPSGSGIQYLDLGTNSFASPVPTINEVSEDISVDPLRALILSASESGSYDLLQTPPSGPVDYQNPLPEAPELDSSAEDCSTGIALASDEETSNVILANLGSAIFTPNSPNSWKAGANNSDLTIKLLPNTVFSAGTTGISVAQGSSHLGIVTGEFGGNSFAILQLPPTKVTGTPDLVDFAYVSSAVFPNEPNGYVFSAGLDPHTVTAYVSPNSGKAIGLMASGPPPNCLAVIDMAAVLGAPRGTDGHTVMSLPSGAISFVWTGQGPNCAQSS
ncbi:MAG TPA: hypothetical protein VJ728_12775 [Candidatus Binataceae bacterium]|nr:hypothetical protein [Candidatus Binataceae bacterium]